MMKVLNEEFLDLFDFEKIILLTIYIVGEFNLVNLSLIPFSIPTAHTDIHTFKKYARQKSHVLLFDDSDYSTFNHMGCCAMLLYKCTYNSPVISNLYRLFQIW